MRRRTQQELEDMARAYGAAAHVEVDNEESIAVLVVNGRETGDYAAVSTLDGSKR